jgi:hypothetical protein
MPLGVPSDLQRVVRTSGGGAHQGTHQGPAGQPARRDASFLMTSKDFWVPV